MSTESCIFKKRYFNLIKKNVQLIDSENEWRNDYYSKVLCDAKSTESGLYVHRWGHLSGLGGQKSGKRGHLSGKKVDIWAEDF